MKLKTLKDITATEIDVSRLKLLKEQEAFFLVGIVSVDDLRREAIKWAKDLKPKIIIEFKGKIYERKYKRVEKGGVDKNEAKIEWIKEFFNITEEDLK